MSALYSFSHELCVDLFKICICRHGTISRCSDGYSKFKFDSIPWTTITSSIQDINTFLFCVLFFFFINKSDRSNLVLEAKKNPRKRERERENAEDDADERERSKNAGYEKGCVFLFILLLFDPNNMLMMSSAHLSVSERTTHRL